MSYHQALLSDKIKYVIELFHPHAKVISSIINMCNNAEFMCHQHHVFQHSRLKF